ncbi:MAG: DUF6268 family outer membrane beta-barrel protein [Thalassolituus sp.]|uniref:DUF6268 family outer membrane beta-barrel protein n=1 Tax=Thalassolituus sp. TaxID=2030822 RepID=UPI0039820044
MHKKSQYIHTASLLILSLWSFQSIAEGNISYSTLNTVDAEQGNKIDKQTLSASYSHLVHISENKRNTLSLGGGVEGTDLAFDDSRLRDTDLLKIKVETKGLHIFESGKLLSWTLTPGLHGQSSELSDANFRVEGQAMFILPSERRQWILGAGFGDQFGKPTFFPVIGSIWSPSERSQWTLMFPMVEYQFTESKNMKYKISVVPDGAQWSWKENTIASDTEASDLSLSGIRISTGIERGVTETGAIAFDLGWVTQRKVEYSQHSDPDLNGSTDLEDAWFMQIGWKFN